jgi:ankyrin repeat protein
MSRKPPPPPKAKPGHVQVVRAIYPYTAQQKDELTFNEGDLLYIIEKSESGWWKARVGGSKGKEGLIPANYIEASTETVENVLHEAAKRGNMSFLEECLSNKVSVNGLDKSGSTPLHWAAAGGHIECAKALLQVPNCELNVQVSCAQ